MTQYTKLTPKTFKQKLDAKEYKVLAGARRAIGKVSDWSEADKSKAQGWINAHFGVTGDAAPSMSVKKTTKKKAVKKKAAKKAVKKAAKKAPVKAVFKTPTKRVAKKAVKAAKAPKQKAYSPRVQTSADKTMLAEINIVGERVGTVAQAIKVLEVAKTHGADVKKGMQEATDIVTGSMTQLKQQVQPSGHNGKSMSAIATKFAESKPAGMAAELGEQSSESEVADS